MTEGLSSQTALKETTLREVADVVNAKFQGFSESMSKLDEKLDEKFAEMLEAIRLLTSTRAVGASSSDDRSPSLHPHDDLITELKNLKETDGIMSYHCKFEVLQSRVQLPEPYLVSAYLAGLRNDTQLHVKMFQPHTIRQCFIVAKLYEAAHPWMGSTTTTSKVSGYPTPHTSFTKAGNRQKEGATDESLLHSASGDLNPPSHSIVSDGVVAEIVDLTIDEPKHLSPEDDGCLDSILDEADGVNHQSSTTIVTSMDESEVGLLDAILNEHNVVKDVEHEVTCKEIQFNFSTSLPSCKASLAGIEKSEFESDCLNLILLEEFVQKTAFEILVTKSVFMALPSSSNFCIQGVRQNAYETLSSVLPPAKPPDEFVPVMNETYIKSTVLVDVCTALWIWFEEPHSSRYDTRPLRVSIEKELTEKCSGILKLVDAELIPIAPSRNSKMLRLKMDMDIHFLISVQADLMNVVPGLYDKNVMIVRTFASSLLMRDVEELPFMQGFMIPSFTSCSFIFTSVSFVVKGGFDMICSVGDKIETPEQFKQAEDTTVKLDLNGLVVIGEDDLNSNACILAENFSSNNLKTKVIGCFKTIDGDLKCKEVPTCFGFDIVCKIYSEMIGNVMIDARSTEKYFHFVRLMGAQLRTSPWSVHCYKQFST